VKNTAEMNEKEWCNAAVCAVRRLAERVGTPKTLKEIGIGEEALSQLAVDASEDICTPGNPKPVSKEEILEIYKKAYNG